MRTLRGLPAGAEVGFFDQRDLELGEDWDAALVDALQSAKVMVAIASPGYWKSEYCGKEWALFRARLTQAAGAGGKPAPLLKPVVWVPFKIDELPPAVTGGQLTFGDPHALHNERGLRYLLKQIQEQRSAYNDLVEALAREIVDAADQHPLAPLATVPKLGQVASAFVDKGAATGGAPGAAGAPAATGSAAPGGPKHVAFIYVAAHPQAFGAARKAEPYVDVGGPDWKPFYPVNTTRVHRFVQSVVAGDDLDFTSETMPFGANLIARIDEAWRQRQIVVLVVDPWSVHWDAQRRARVPGAAAGARQPPRLPLVRARAVERERRRRDGRARRDHGDGAPHLRPPRQPGAEPDVLSRRHPLRRRAQARPRRRADAAQGRDQEARAGDDADPGRPGEERRHRPVGVGPANAMGGLA